MNKILIDSYFFTLRSQLLQPEQSREKLVRDGKIEVCKIQNWLTYDFFVFLEIFDNSRQAASSKIIRGSGKQFIATVFFINSLNTKVAII